MGYWDGTRYRNTQPVLIPDVRQHLLLWRHFNKATGSWPVLSMAAFGIRFVVIIAGVALLLWYGELHRFSKGQEFGLALLLLLPATLLWFGVELLVWNYDLRKKGVSSTHDLWSINQFPPK